MRTVYKCSHCGRGQTFDIPASIGVTVQQVLESVATGESFGDRNVRIMPFVCHPCEPGIHGIAPIVAVIE
jgi:hypothetical protein